MTRIGHTEWGSDDVQRNGVSKLFTVGVLTMLLCDGVVRHQLYRRAVISEGLTQDTVPVGACPALGQAHPDSGLPFVALCCAGWLLWLGARPSSPSST